MMMLLFLVASLALGPVLIGTANVITPHSEMRQALVPDDIAQQIDSIMRQDSVDASHLIAIPFWSDLQAAAHATKLPVALLAAFVQEESRFDQWAGRVEPRYLASRVVRRAAARWSRAHRGMPSAETELQDRARSYGLMQVMGETAREEAYNARYLAQLYNARDGLLHGALHLQRLVQRYGGDTLSAISAYNQGSARSERGVYLNARYVYRVVVAWHAYERYSRERYAHE